VYGPQVFAGVEKGAQAPDHHQQHRNRCHRGSGKGVGGHNKSDSVVAVVVVVVVVVVLLLCLF
jgi:hypothetical protein